MYAFKRTINNSDWMWITKMVDCWKKALFLKNTPLQVGGLLGTPHTTHLSVTATIKLQSIMRRTIVLLMLWVAILAAILPTAADDLFPITSDKNYNYFIYPNEVWASEKRISPSTPVNVTSDDFPCYAADKIMREEQAKTKKMNKLEDRFLPINYSCLKTFSEKFCPINQFAVVKSINISNSWVPPDYFCSIKSTMQNKNKKSMYYYYFKVVVHSLLEPWVQVENVDVCFKSCCLLFYFTLFRVLQSSWVGVFTR